MEPQNDHVSARNKAPDPRSLVPEIITRPVRSFIGFVRNRLSSILFEEKHQAGSVGQHSGCVTKRVGEPNAPMTDSAASMNIDSGNRSVGLIDVSGEIVDRRERIALTVTANSGEESECAVNPAGTSRGMRSLSTAAGPRPAVALRHTRVHKTRHLRRALCEASSMGIRGAASFRPPSRVGIPVVSFSLIPRSISICVPMWYCDSRLHGNLNRQLNPCFSASESSSICDFSTNWHGSRWNNDQVRQSNDCVKDNSDQPLY